MFKKKQKDDLDIELDNSRNRISKDLIEKLKNIDDWNNTDSVSYRDGVVHKKYNLMVYVNEYGSVSIVAPITLELSSEWKDTAKQQIRRIQKYVKLKEMQFLSNVINDVYPLQIKYSPLKEEVKQWIKCNGKKDKDYVMHKCRSGNVWAYFKSEEMAVAFKLKWM